MELPFIVTIQPDELLYSFILRLMAANGYNSTLSFVQNCISPQKHRLSYDVGYDLYNLLECTEFEDIQSFYLNTTIYKGVFPLIDRKTASGYFNVKPNKPMIKELKYCPICKQEDKVFYYHRAHQMPGVTMCYKHGCALNTYIGTYNKELEEIQNSITNEIYSKSLEYAIFTKELLDTGIQISLEETLKLIPSHINYDLEMKDYLDLIKESPNDYLNNINAKSSHQSKEILLTILLFLYKDVSNLSKNISIKKYELNNDFKLESSYRNDLVEVKCMRCNESFLSLPNSLKCPKCDYISKLNKKPKMRQIRTPKVLPDDFELVDKATNSIYATFKHRVCGNVFNYNYYNFYKKPKCKICDQKINNILCVDVKQDRIIDINRYDGIYNWIKDNYTEDDIIFSDEIQINNLPKAVITDNIKKYVKLGQLQNIDRGIYAFPNKYFTTDKVIEERFVVYKDKRIGYYCGESFMYEIGLLDKKPDKVTIVTNKVETLHGRSVYIRGIEVRIYGSRVKITKDNYPILAIIRFFINIKRCNYKVEGNYFYKIYKWLKAKNITENDFEEYYSYFQDWIKLRIKEIYKEGSLCEE